MHTVVMMTKNEDEEIVPVSDRKWCLVSHSIGGGVAVALCTGECFGAAEGVAEGMTKTVQRGGITCADCLKILQEFKAIRL